MKYRVVWASLLLFGGFAHACGGDDPAAPPPKPVVDAGRDVSNDGSTDARPDRAETGPDVDAGPGCAAPRRMCGTECVDVSSNNRHCGACGKDCGAAAVCTDGICLAPCGVDQARCLGQCVSLGTDNVNCGRCSQRCADGLVCSSGTCRLECAPPLGTCPPAHPVDASSGSDATADAAADAVADGAMDAAPPERRYCADFTGDERNCGACGVRCAPGQECVQGHCDTSCVVGQTRCGSACFDLSTDLAHCGSCDHACAAGEVCSGASCQASCGFPFARCGNRCANFASDPENCGDCGRVCRPDHATAATCAAGQCGYARCAAGFADCDGDQENGCEQPVASDPNNCGFCGNQCRPANASGASCGSGKCNYGTCAAGFDDCDGIRANGCETFVDGDVKNCGVCGRTCALGELCNHGNCAGAQALTSYVFPGAVAGNPFRPRATKYTLATIGPATIYYTLNGSVPTPGVAGTTTIASPVTLPAVDGVATIRWFAQFPGGFLEGEQTLTHTTSATTTVNLGTLSENMRINGGGPIAVVPASKTVTGTVDYTVWSSDPTGYCPGCILQYVIVVDGVGTSAGCTNVGVAGSFPGVSGAQSFTFISPAKAGTYFVRAGLTQQFSCDGTMPGGEPIGMIVVQ